MAKRFAMALLVVCLCSILAWPQTTPDQPSRYVWYEIVQINNGKADLYNKVVAQYRDAANTSAPDVYWLAGTPITGESDHVFIVTFHPNMASIEKTITMFGKAEESVTAKNASFTSQVAEAEGPSHWVLAEYSKELSYRSEMVPMAQTTWWTSSLFSLRPGCEYEFNEVVKQVADLHKKAGDNEHWSAYQIRAGYPEPSVLFVTTMRSLADMDEEANAAAKEMFESASMRQMFQKIGKECIAHIESTYAQVAPQMSRMPQAVVAANPDFWTIKEQPTPAATKKPKEKKQPVKAALTEPGTK